MGAKRQVHRRIRELASEGMASLVISSEIPELVELCDRIYVMCDGRVTGELSGADATPSRILELAFSRSKTQKDSPEESLASSDIEDVEGTP